MKDTNTLSFDCRQAELDTILDMAFSKDMCQRNNLFAPYFIQPRPNCATNGYNTIETLSAPNSQADFSAKDVVHQSKIRVRRLTRPRRPVTELTRLNVCEVDGCGLRYENRRTLQYHMKKKHNQCLPTLRDLKKAEMERLNNEESDTMKDQSCQSSPQGISSSYFHSSPVSSASASTFVSANDDCETPIWTPLSTPQYFDNGVLNFLDCNLFMETPSSQTNITPQFSSLNLVDYNLLSNFFSLNDEVSEIEHLKTWLMSEENESANVYNPVVVSPM